jgi:hypothetical protein
MLTRPTVSSAPYIKLVNTFLRDFIDSSEKTVEFTADDLKPNAVVRPILQSLQGEDYEIIRCRLRVISNLNPVVNTKTEEGKILLGFSSSSGIPQNIEIRSLFAPKGKSISLEIVKVASRAE